MSPDIKLRGDRLFLVESKEDETVHLALGPEYVDEHMRWFDTTRPRMKHGRLLSSSPEHAVFEAEDGARYAFRVCTLQDYETQVRPFVEGNPSFSSEEELHRFYSERFEF